MSRRSTWRKAAQRRSARTRTHSAVSSLGRSLYRRRLRLEPLEDRRLLAVVTVNTLADTVDFNDGVTSLREAIFAANTVPGADTIEFAPSLTAGGPATMLLTHGEFVIAEELAINGPGASLLTIDAQQQSRIFNITATAGNFTVAGLTLTGGRTTFGPKSASGGAIQSSTEGLLTIERCIIRGNTVTSLASGGGISARGDVLVQLSIVRENNARWYGGGILAERNVTLDRSEVIDNFASSGAGGGIFAIGTISLIGSTVSGNTAGNMGSGTEYGGGGLYARRDVIAVSSIISENNASWGGGIKARGNVTLKHSVVTGNSALTLAGGVIALRDWTLTHSIVSGNSDTLGIPDLMVFGKPIQFGYSLIGDRRGTTFVVVEAPIGSPDANGNLIGGPVHGVIDPQLGPLADNGGFELPDGSRILTHALLPGSPAINAGDLNAVAGVGGVPEFDQRGEPFRRIVGGRFDIGAFEYQTPTDLNLFVDTLVDESDGDYSRGDLSLREAIELANANDFEGVTDTIRFDPALTAEGPATILLTHGELTIADSLTIDGPGADQLTVDARGNDPTPELDNGDGSRVFSMYGDVSLSGLTLTGGDVNGDGGAIESVGSLVISDSAVIGNAASGDGGGLATTTFAPFVRGLTVSNCRILGNLSGHAGGGLTAVAIGGEILIAESTISGNITNGIRSTGGGIFLRGNRSTATILNSAIEANTSEWDGGGIYISQQSYNFSVSIETSMISENSAGHYGGGVHNSEDLKLFETTVTRNSAQNGGGIYDQSGRTIEIADSTISGNSAIGEFGDGGGITHLPSSSRFASLTISHSTIAGNSAARYGGGILTGSGGAPVTIIGSLIQGNNAGQDAGGVYGFHSRITVTASSIDGNTAGRDGGGAKALSGSLTLDGTSVSDNFAGRDGGGLLAGRLALRDSTIRGNSAARDGGGVSILTLSESAAFTGNTIAENSAGRNGGGIAAFAVEIPQFVGQFDVSNSTLSGNTAGEVGGGIWTNAYVTIRHSTVFANEAEVAGGGAFTSYGSLTLDHAIVAGNTSVMGPDATGLLGASIVARFSLIGSSLGTGLTPSPYGQPDAYGNFIGYFGAPIDPLLGPLADNGGFELPDGSRILTHALLRGSPAIDAGDPAAVAGVSGVPVHDQRGAPFTRVYGRRIDMGAVESLPSGLLPGDYNVDGIVDAADYTVWCNTLNSLNNLRADGNGDGVVDALDYAVWMSNFGATGAEQEADPATGYPGGEQTARAEPVAPLLADRLAPEQFVVADRLGPQADFGTHTAGQVSRVGAVAQRFKSMTNAARQDRLLEAWLAGRAGDPHPGPLPEGEGVREPVAHGEQAGADPEALDCALAELGEMRLAIGR